MNSDENPGYEILFTKLAEASLEQPISTAEVTQEEASEIAELRRIILEVSEPQYLLYTTT